MSSQPESSIQSEADLRRQWEAILAAEGLGELTPNEVEIPSGDGLDVLAPYLAQEREKAAKKESQAEQSSGFDTYQSADADDE